MKLQFIGFEIVDYCPKNPIATVEIQMYDQRMHICYSFYLIQF